MDDMLATQAGEQDGDRNWEWVEREAQQNRLIQWLSASLKQTREALARTTRTIEMLLSQNAELV